MIDLQKCPNCKGSIGANAQFCGNCGASLGKSRKISIVSAVLGALILVIAIAAYVVFLRPKPKAYFPLKEGMSFRFRLKNENIPVYGESGTIDWQMLRSRELNGRNVIPRRVTRRAGRPSIQFLAENSDGISVVATQFGDDGEVRMADQPTYILKYPIRVGTTWDEWVLDLDAPPQRRRVDLKARIESTNEIATVVAGTFKRCLKVKSVGSTDGISVELYKWYAPGVGMVKFIDHRQSLDGSTPSKQMTVELQEFKYPE